MKNLISRKRLQDLNDWYSGANRKPLILRGARQVGKSTLIKIFAAENNLSLFEVNFEKYPEVKEAFETFDVSEILKLLCVILNKRNNFENTLLFLDEIQVSPKAIVALRYFYEDLPELPVVAAGSLLDFALEGEKNFSMPVGRVDYMYLGPLTFEEFLIAREKNLVLEFIQSYKLEQNFPEVLHKQLITLLREYYIVGGMPEATSVFSKTLDISQCERAKQSIISTYIEDFSKYKGSSNTQLLEQLFDALPASQGNRIIYSHVADSYRSIIVKEHIRQLNKAKVFSPIFHSSANGIPLGAEKNEKKFKQIFLDVGLLATSLNISLKDILSINELNLINKGVVAEQFIGQHLLYNRPFYEKPSLYYWERDKKGSQAEVDYLTTYKDFIVPIEVKAGKSTRLKSLEQFVLEKNCKLAIRFNSELPEFTVENRKNRDKEPFTYNLLSLPLYLVEQVDRLISEAFLKL